MFANSFKNAEHFNATMFIKYSLGTTSEKSQGSNHMVIFARKPRVCIHKSVDGRFAKVKIKLCTMYNTVEPLKNGPLKSGQPLYKGHFMWIEPILLCFTLRLRLTE